MCRPRYRNAGFRLINFTTLLLLLTLVVGSSLSAQPPKLKALIVDGQNNHGNWPQTTELMQHWLQDSGRFQVEVARTTEQGVDEDFAPRFSDYQVVISNYNGAEWSAKTKQAFVDFVREGGGFVTVHAADNAFPNWREYNEMIGLGGWGGRNQDSGPYVYFDESKQAIVQDPSDGQGGSHGREHPFRVVIRNHDHPITAGMPGAWMHVKDELYDRLRGPAENMTVLATAFSDPETGGSGRHEPMMMTVSFGKGRVFHLPLGHSNESQQCTGFITALTRGAEWAATGEVTLEVPEDFPGMDATKSRVFEFDR